MKKSLVCSILGFTIAITNLACGQGGIYINNYQAPYNPVIWGPWAPLPEQAVRSTQGVQLTLWYGEGVLSAEQLMTAMPLNWNLGSEAMGYAGYYYGTALLPTWSEGETWTFQVRASGTSIYGQIDDRFGRSRLWYENEEIRFVGGDPPYPPGSSKNSIGFAIVPEPSAVSLGGLALATAWAYRRSRDSVAIHNSWPVVQQ